MYTRNGKFIEENIKFKEFLDANFFDCITLPPKPNETLVANIKTISD